MHYRQVVRLPAALRVPLNLMETHQCACAFVHVCVLCIYVPMCMYGAARSKNRVS